MLSKGFKICNKACLPKNITPGVVLKNFAILSVSAAALPNNVKGPPLTISIVFPTYGLSSPFHLCPTSLMINGCLEPNLLFLKPKASLSFLALLYKLSKVGACCCMISESL